MRDHEKTAYTAATAARGANKLVDKLRRIAVGEPSSFRKVLVGSSDTDLGPKAVTGRLGTFDADLYDARRYQKQFQRAGLGDVDVGLREGGDIDVDQLMKIQDALPGYYARARMGMAKSDPAALAERQEKWLGKLREAGVEATPEQLKKLMGTRTGVMETGRSLKNLMWGEAPVQTIKERFLRGGLMGRGGVLTADLAPDVSLRRRYGRFYDAMKNQDYRAAAGEAPAVAIGTGGYGANLAFNYGLPGYLAYEGYQQARDTGESPAKALGASALASGANMAMAPFGAVQMFTLDPIQRGIYKGFGVKPPDAPEVQLAGGEAGAAPQQQRQTPPRQTGYRRALQNIPQTATPPYPYG